MKIQEVDNLTTTSSGNDSAHDHQSISESKHKQKVEFYGLHEEIKSLILGFLHPRDLASAEQVCKNWKELIREDIFWRRKISSDLFYLKEEELFNTNPRGLYIQQKTNYQISLRGKNEQFSIKQLFASIQGEFKEIDQNSSLTEQSRQFLYSFAVAHRHYSALSKLQDNAGTALAMSASFGELNSFKRLLDKKPTISIEQKCNAFVQAARRSRFEIVDYLLKKFATEISIETKVKAFIEAAFCGQLLMIKHLLQIGAEITDGNASKAFEAAAKGGHLETISHLLKNFTTKISVESKGIALQQAINFRKIEAAMYLLQTETEITNEDRGKALCLAGVYGYSNVTKHLLEGNYDISAEHKNMAIFNAAKSNHTECFAYLLNKVGNIWLTSVGLNQIIENGNLNIVTLLLKVAKFSYDLLTRAKMKAREKGFNEIADLITEEIYKTVGITPVISAKSLTRRRKSLGGGSS